MTFYTGLTSMAVFLAAFNFISSAIPQYPNNKLTHFVCFTMTMMKTHLKLCKYGLAFRFVVLESTVGRVFTKWICLCVVDFAFFAYDQFPVNQEVSHT